MKKISLIFLSITVCLLAISSANGAAGDLDPTFGRVGFKTVALDVGADRATGVVRQPDGKIVVVGNQSESYNGTVTVVRFNADGSLDTTFSGDGIATDGYGLANAVALQTDGKIVITGRIASINATLFSVTRFNADGSLDQTFSGDGRFTDTAEIVGNAIAIQPDGKIVVAGTGRNAVAPYAFSAVRLNSDGTPDTTFDGDGKVFTPINKSGEKDDFATALVLQTDGKIVVGGNSYFADTARDFTLVRYNSDGSLDTTFDGDGKVQTAFEAGAQNDILQSLAVDANGRIVAAGYASVGPRFEAFALARYNSDGSLDTTFDGDGKVFTRTREDSFERAYAVTIQPDGKIVVAGQSGFFVTDFTVLRYNADGSLDSSFGRGGVVYTRPSEQYNSGLRAVTLAPNGDIIAAGFAGKGNETADFAFARYNSAGVRDGSLGIAGYVTNNNINYPNQSTEATDVAIQTDGKIIVVGNRIVNSTTTIGVLTRYNADGSIDRMFGGSNFGGVVDVNIPQPGTHEATAVAIQPDGKILVLVSYDGDSDAGFYIMRFNANGQKDLPFGGNNAGYAYLGVQDGGGLGRDIASLPDGKILVAGASANFTTQTLDFAVFKFNSDGSRATAFGSNGIAAISLSPGSDVAFSLVVQPDGKIVAAGAANFDENKDGSAALVRYNADGSVDNSFGASGRVITQIGTFADTISSVALQSDGKIVGGGIACRDGGCTGGGGILLRYNANGSLDQTFDGDGKVFVPSSAPGLSTGISTIVVQTDGKIVAGGIIANSATADDALVARYNSDGSLDASFGNGGIVSGDIGKTAQFSNSIALQPDGKIVSVGASSTGTRTDFAVWRYLGSGAAPTITRTRFDFDGDGKSDVSVYRPANGVWYLLNSQTGFSAVQFGVSTDRIVPADYDGDGKTDVAVYRDGIWYLQRSAQGFGSVQFGSPGDVPAPADFDGDGKAELAVFRPSNGTWYVLNLVGNQFSAVQFGVAEDKPVAADYDGDGKSDYAVYRPSNGVWYSLQSAKGFSAIQFGISTDKPAVGDYDGDGRADQAVYRSENGVWYLFQSTKGFASIQFGISTDLPAPADYDGDGKTDVAVFRPTNGGNWYLNRSAQGFAAVQFGSSGDKPAPNAFIP